MQVKSPTICWSSTGDLWKQRRRDLLPGYSRQNSEHYSLLTWTFPAKFNDQGFVVMIIYIAKAGPTSNLAS